VVTGKNAEVPVQDTLVLVRVFATFIKPTLLFDLLFNGGELLFPMRRHVPWRAR